MNSPAECAVIIPCLNEAKTILPLVREIHKHAGNVIVVDDGSSDDTVALARKTGAEVLCHGRRRGKGAALNTGWQRAAERGFTWALAMDGDGQHAPDDIPAFLSAAMDCDADLIVGNRFENPGGMPWLRRNVNQWMSRRLSNAAGFPMPDSQCGFRMMRLGAWSRLTMHANHFEIESEVLLRFVLGGYKVRFIPVQTIYGAERSKINPIWDTWRWYHWWLRIRELIDTAHEVKEASEPILTAPPIAAKEEV